MNSYLCWSRPAKDPQQNYSVAGDTVRVPDTPSLSTLIPINLQLLCLGVQEQDQALF